MSTALSDLAAAGPPRNEPQRPVPPVPTARPRRRRAGAHVSAPVSTRTVVDLDGLRERWRTALEAAHAALLAAGTTLPVYEVQERSKRLSAEQAQVVQLLELMAREHRSTVRARS